jgi:hypothetical protein
MAAIICSSILFIYFDGNMARNTKALLTVRLTPQEFPVSNRSVHIDDDICQINYILCL